LLDGVAEVHEVASAFVAIPEGYRLPRTRAEVHPGGHPNARLISSGLEIGAINAERAKWSAIKGGRLGARVRGRAVTLVYSDVSSGKLRDVASGPSDRNMILVADNDTLTAAAVELIGERAVRWSGQIECDVAEAARLLANRQLDAGQILVAGGEPTVTIRGDGRGGRCSELAVRFAMESAYEALFASSDGVDGNSGAAGIYLPRRSGQAESLSYIEAALAVSNSFPIAAQVGEPIMIAPTGNNLRDLFLVARD
jgi:glycerate-2-kinase